MAAAAGAGEAIGFVGDMLGTVTFLNFINEEALQTLMMAAYVADKSNLDFKRVILPILRRAEAVVMNAQNYNNTIGGFNFWAQGAFRAFYNAVEESVGVYYAKQIKRGLESRTLKSLYVGTGYYYPETRTWYQHPDRFLAYLKDIKILVDPKVYMDEIEPYKIGDLYLYEPTRFQTIYPEQFRAHLEEQKVLAHHENQLEAANKYRRGPGYHFNPPQSLVDLWISKGKLKKGTTLADIRYFSTQGWRMLRHLYDLDVFLEEVISERAVLMV